MSSTRFLEGGSWHSQFGRPRTYATALTSAEREFVGGTGPCDVLSFSGRLVPAEAARLENTIDAYNAQLAAACKRFPECRYDGGAFAHVRVRREYLSSDFEHFSVEVWGARMLFSCGEPVFVDQSAESIAT